MKVIYCASSVDINELKTEPGSYAASKISTMFKNTAPRFVREFESISNIEYIKVQNYPDFYRLWNDMMNKITFAYNFRYLESKKLFEEYIEFNERIAAEINATADPEDLVIVNDASLYLLPGMVDCRVAVRNLDFDECFIERVPYYKPVLRELMKAEKFFSTRTAMRSFHRFLDCSLELSRKRRGGCHYMRDYVDKETVLDALNCASIYRLSLNSNRAPASNEIVKHLRQMRIPKKTQVLLTNAPLLHLEAYIKANPGLNVRYVRSSVEIDEKQERMVQYLKKAYDCVIDVIDKHSHGVLALEMLHCDIFIGSKYQELAKLLRKPYVETDNDSKRLSERIKGLIGTVQPKTEVYGENEYLEEFMEAAGYDVVHNIDYTVDGQIDTYILDLIGWMSGSCLGVSGGSPGAQDTPEQRPSAPAACPLPELEIYKKIVDGEDAYFMKKASYRIYEAASRNRRAVPLASQPAGDRSEAAAQEQQAKTLNALCKCALENKPCSCAVKAHPEADGLSASEESSEDVGTPKELDAGAIASAWRSSGRVALLDYDGTLTKIEKLPHLAEPSRALIELLQKFNQKNRCIICTGRSQEDVDRWFPREFEVYAEHGACHRVNGKWSVDCAVKELQDCVEIMEYYHIRTPGSVIEKKTSGAAFHYKLAPEFDSEMLYYLLRKYAGKAVIAGKDVIEVRSGNKKDIARRVKPDLVVGDDVTDEDMYGACNGVTIKVGGGETRAEWSAKNVPQLLALLQSLCE
ncbi:trehalose 6-phosphate synthase/phosphatase [Pancytospora philotis]|nr:trehalose 6-phosphate synthase/phosphatase [Pancytospora philotis]